MSDTILISLSDAHELMADALGASGAGAEIAASVARALVAAEAEGQVGHGFSRLGDYAAQLASGKINPQAQVRIAVDNPASVLLDAECGFAYPALDRAHDIAMARAQSQGVALVGITNSHHCGALSVQVDRLARAGLIGLMVANTPKAIAPWGGNQALFGTNPIAFAAPRAGADPLVIDLSLSKVARGKVMNAARNGKPIPEGWALDADGNATTDPNAALDGTMLPIGDAKGTALALMVEILAAPLNGAAASYQATSFFAASGDAPRVGQTLIAIKPHAGDDFAARLADLLAQITTQDGTRLPGTRRLDALAKAAAEGLSVPVQYIDQARALAKRG